MPNDKVATIPVAPITQERLANFVQLRAQVAREKEDMDRLRMNHNGHMKELRKEWAAIRREIMRGSHVDEGPIEAFMHTEGHGKKRRKTLVIK